MKYTPSKFNYCHKCDSGELLLYNSTKGTDSLIRVIPEKAESILSVLKNGCNDDFGEIEALLARGFVIHEHTDENIVKKYRIMEQVMDSSLHLILLPTEQCNFRCKYCYETFKKGKMSQDIQDSIIKYIRKNIHKHTGLYVSWFGGEPLEGLDVIENLSKTFINICKVAKKTYSASMTTNGYALSIETYHKLYELGVYHYQITIDGLKDEHDRQRILVNGDGTFSRIITNLVDIKNKSKHFNTSFIIRTNFTKRIYDHIEDFLKFYIETFNDDGRFNFYAHMASDWGGDRVSDFNHEMLCEHQYSNIIKSIIKYGIKINHDSHFFHLDYKGCVCYASRKNSIVIGSDGILYKCTGDFEYEKNMVGVLTQNGELQYNENHILWLGGLNECDSKCDNCFYSACCLSNNCPAIRVRNLSNDTCSFEKENLGLFLELFNKNLFYHL